MTRLRQLVTNRLSLPPFRLGRPCIQDPFRGRERLRPSALDAGCQALQVGQGGHNAGLKQHIYRAVLTPEDQGRAMIRPFEACAFIAGSFCQPLLVRRLPVARTGREQLAAAERNAAKLDGAIIRVAPFVDVLPGVID